MEGYLATCPDEARDVLSAELKDLGADNITPGYRMLRFHASKEDWYRMHLKLSTASSLFQVLRDCAGGSASVLRSQALRIPWHRIFSPLKSFRVNGIAGDRGTSAMSSNEISREIRLAIEDVMLRETGQKPRVELDEPDVVIVCHVHRKRATICLNTAGKALHKRGYRKGGHPAPLKETMAATLLRLVGYDGTQNFYDPMCGSGTILIEAGFIAMNKACNIHRKKDEFGLEHLLSFDRSLWRRVQDECRRQRREHPQALLEGADMVSDYVSAARDNALRARVEKYMKIECRSFFEPFEPASSGILVTNLPYGDRLSTGDMEAKEFYRMVGDTLKKNFSGWTAALFVSDASPWKHIGLRPTRKIPLLNGNIPARLLIFELYKGSRKKQETGE